MAGWEEGMSEEDELLMEKMVRKTMTWTGDNIFSPDILHHEQDDRYLAPDVTTTTARDPRQPFRRVSE